MDSISAFARLQNVCTATKKYINFDELPIGEHLVKYFQLDKSKFGMRVEAVLCSGNTIGLPERFHREFPTQIDIDALNENQHILVYKGKDKQRNNRIMLDFILQKPKQ
jgi:hypothetical protein